MPQDLLSPGITEGTGSGVTAAQMVASEWDKAGGFESHRVGSGEVEEGQRPLGEAGRGCIS